MEDVAIQVDGVEKRFGEVVALAGVDLEVPTGSVLGLLGPNGAGKTTMVRVLATILRPDRGRALVLGHDVVRDAASVRRQIGLAGQYATVDPNLTGRENLRLIARLTHLQRKVIAPRVAELLERFELTDAADRPVRTYSGGMRRRLDLGAALVQRPPVLFLDEPTTGLDPHSRSEMWAMIEELVADGTTVVLTTQYLEEADRLADRIAVVDHGKVIANDTPSQLKAMLGSTVIEIGLGDHVSASRAQALLRTLDVHAELDGGAVRVTASDGPRVLVDVLRSLDAGGLAPATLAVREPSLDDVFLTLTGSHTEDEAEPVPTGRRAA